MNGVAVALVGSTGVGTCGHHTQATTGSNNVYINGMPIHRVGDLGIVTDPGGGDYTMIEGSPNTSG
jgi:uncharacterized Zn-binding protein involved in type VI secretion